MSINLFGIKNCDTVKKAKTWLLMNDIRFEFIDIRQSPVGEGQWIDWLQQISQDKLINKKSTSWRKLTSEQQNLTQNSDAVNLLMQFPTLMKRPLLLIDNEIRSLGFKAESYQTIFQKNKD